MGLEEAFQKIQEAIDFAGTPADDGSFASGYQTGLKEGLEKARSIIILGTNPVAISRLKALSRKEARENTELSREDKILGLMEYYGISRRKAIAELEDFDVDEIQWIPDEYVSERALVKCPRCGQNFAPPFEGYPGYCSKCIEETYVELERAKELRDKKGEST